MLRQRAIPLILATKPHKVGNGVRRLARQKMRWTFYGVKAALKPRTKKTAGSLPSRGVTQSLRTV